MSDDRLAAICPACKQRIYLHNLLEAQARISACENPIFSVTMLHGAQGEDRHALTLFIDRNMKVRDAQVSNLLLEP